MKKCPYCGAQVDFCDFDNDFTSFEDQGDCIVATGHFDCQCGENLRIKAVFVFNEDYEID